MTDSQAAKATHQQILKWQKLHINRFSSSRSYTSTDSQVAQATHQQSLKQHKLHINKWHKLHIIQLE
jgi:hypothetical protein